MLVIFSTVVIDPERHEELVAAVGSWLDQTIDERSAATAYEFLVNPADPSRLHYFQAWPDKRSFETWLASDAHQNGVFREDGVAHDSWALLYEGCPDATVIRPPSR